MEKIYSTILSYQVTAYDEGKKVENVLKREFKISSGCFTYLKLNGKIFINNEICRSIDTVKAGDIVSADIGENSKTDISECDIPVNILFEDSHILVAEKPPALSMHPCIGNYETTFAGAIIKHYRKNGENLLFHAVNRLDKDTSGLCLIAKNRYSHNILSSQSKSSLLKKEYKAIVHGKIDKNGIIDLPIERAEESMMKRIVSENGKNAVTEFFPVVFNDDYSLVRICLKTGRTHQIRVHFSHIGHPLYGDWLYGDGDNEKELILRQALHSSKISFLHPISNEKMCFESEIYKDMQNLLKKLKKS